MLFKIYTVHFINMDLKNKKMTLFPFKPNGNNYQMVIWFNYQSHMHKRIPNMFTYVNIQVYTHL